ncbi:MAG: MFS transporter [Chloroflexota bacterium]|nr:MFS transporter [Chloroflexota bacterium]
MRWQWHFGLGRELGYAFWALTFFEAVLGAYAPIWPVWIERLGAPISIVGLVLASAGVIRPFVLGPGAALTDRFNTRNVLIVCRTASICGLVIAAFAGTWQILFVTVVLNALGELAFPTIHAYVADHAGDDPVHAFNMTITIGPAGGLIVTPLISGLIIAWGGIEAAFLFSAFLTLCALGFVSRMDFSSTRASQAGPDERVTYRKALQHQGIRSLIVLHGATIAALAIGVALIPNFLEDERGISPSTIAILSSGAALGTVAFGVISSRNRILRQSPVFAAALATILVVFGLVIFGTQGALPLIAIAYVMRGGVFSAWALFLAAMGKVAPVHLRSRGFTVMEIIGGGAMSFGPIVASQLWNISPTSPLFVAACLGAVMATIMILFHRRDARVEPVEQTAAVDCQLPPL